MKKFLSNLGLFQVLALLSGSLFSWNANFIQFKKFYELEGTIFKLKGAAMTNPFMTPCVWGATAFVAAFVWAFYIFRLKAKNKIFLQQTRLMWFLIASNIFAWSVVGYEFSLFYEKKMQPFTSCTGLVKSPLETACFTGSLIFLLSLLITFLLVNKLKKKS